MRGRPPLTLIFGMMKSGKSYHAKRLAAKQKGRVWIWDPNPEWAGPLGVDPLPDCWPATEWDHALTVLIERGEPVARVAWQLPPERFEDWCCLVRYCGDMMAIVDEAHDPLGPGKPEHFARSMVRKTRHSRVDLVLVAQRPTGIDINIRSQAHQVVCYQMSEEQDLKWIAGHCGARMRDIVRNLPPKRNVTWIAGKGILSAESMSWEDVS